MDKKSAPKTKKKAIAQPRSCPECKTTMNPGRITLHFEQNGYYADVENVPAMICSRCGTRSVPGPSAMKISETVQQLFAQAKNLDATGISFHKLAS